MADNTQLNSGAGGDLISTDDLGGGVKVQRVKVQVGADGAAADVHAGNPLPVSDAGGSLTVDVGAALPAGNNNIGDVDVASVAGNVTVVQATASNLNAQVQGSTAHDAAIGATNPVVVGYRADASVPGVVSANGDVVRAWGTQSGAAMVRVEGGFQASGVAVSSNPVTTGGRADSGTPTAVANGQAVNQRMTLTGAAAIWPVDSTGDSCTDDANNALRVSIVAGAGSGGTSMTDDAAFTVGVSGVTPAAGYYLAARDTVNDGDAGALAMTERRALYAALETPGGDSMADETTNSLQVKIVASDLALGGTALADDAAFTPGTTNVTPVAGIYRSARDLVDDNDAGALAMTQRRALLVALESPGGDSLVDDTSDTVKVGGGVATDASVTNLAPVLAGARAADSRLGAVSADGDAVPLRTNRHGELYSHLITPNGDSCVDDTADAVKVSVVNGSSGGTSMVDDAAFTPGTTAVTPVAGIYRSTLDTVNDGDAGALAMDANRSLHTVLVDNNGVSCMDSTDSALRVLVVDGVTVPAGLGDYQSSGAIDADEETVSTSTNAGGVVGVEVYGTWVGTLQFEARGVAAGLADVWYPITAYPTNSATGVTSTTGNGLWQIQGSGTFQVRIRASDWTSGTANVVFQRTTVGFSPPPGAGGGGGTQYAEDVAHTTGDTGTLALAVRRDAQSPGSGTNGDYSTLNVDANGALYVALTDGIGSSLVRYEDATASGGHAGVPVLVVRRDAATSATSADGDYAMLGVNANGRIWASATIDAALPTGTNNIGDVDIASIAAGDNNIGNVDIVTMPGTVVEDAASAGGETSVLVAAVRRDTASSGVGADGDFAHLAVSSAGRLWASATIDAALPAGTNNIGDVDVLSLPALPAGTNNIGDVDVLTLPGIAGSAAHDAAVSGNPVLVAGYAETPDDSAPANQVSAEGDATRLTTDRDGAVYTHPHPPRIWHVATEYTTQQTDTSVKATPGAGLSLYITDITINCNGAVTVTLEEGTTTTKFKYYGSAAGDGTNKQFIVPLKLAANTALTVTTSGAVTCFVGVNGYTAP